MADPEVKTKREPSEAKKAAAAINCAKARAARAEKKKLVEDAKQQALADELFNRIEAKKASMARPEVEGMEEESEESESEPEPEPAPKKKRAAAPKKKRATKARKPKPESESEESEDEVSEPMQELELVPSAHVRLRHRQSRRSPS